MAETGGLMAHEKGAMANRKKADEHAASLRHIFEDIRAEGITSIMGTARALSDRGVTAPRGGPMSRITTRKYMVRLGYWPPEPEQ